MTSLTECTEKLVKANLDSENTTRRLINAKLKFAENLHETFGTGKPKRLEQDKKIYHEGYLIEFRISTGEITIEQVSSTSTIKN